MNDYDKAGRYLVKREPAGFFRWLLANSGVSFEAWIDARRVALPDQNDLTNDLVAVLRSGDVLEGICLELEAKARADVLTRLPWAPLMQGGCESGIIEKWLREAERRVTGERDRADLGLMAQVFAALAGCRPAWEHGLRGWNMKTSPVFDEIRAEGQVEGMRKLVFR